MMEILTQRPDIQKIIEEIAQEQKFENYEIVDITTNQKGEGYLSQVFLVSIKDSSKTLNFVIKAAFREEKIRQIVPIRNSFLNEIFIYTQLEPIFRKFESEAGVAPFQFLPKCYKTCSEEKREMLCLENLRAQGFEVFDKKKILDDEHISLIFNFYGRYHAYTYALKEKQPEVYQSIVDKLHNVYYEILDDRDGTFATFLKSLESCIEKYFEPGKDDELKEKYRKYRGDGIIDEYAKIVSEKCNFFTILHGDCWSNNMMFKYKVEENQRKPIEMRLLDLQLAKEGSPVCDLSYSLYSGASKSVFDNLDKYLRIYHNSLTEHLKAFGCDSEKIFSFETLQDHWRKYSRFGMIMALAVIRGKCVDQEDIQDFTDYNVQEGQGLSEMKFNEDEFQDRVMKLFNHLSEIKAL